MGRMRETESVLPFFLHCLLYRCMTFSVSDKAHLRSKYEIIEKDFNVIMYYIYFYCGNNLQKPAFRIVIRSQ